MYRPGRCFASWSVHFLFAGVAFVILLGYGPIALLIGTLGIAAEQLHLKKNGHAVSEPDRLAD
jgi:hypothetical protein